MLFIGVALTACHGDIGATGQVARPPRPEPGHSDRRPASSPSACRATAPPGIAPLRRLSAVEYTNTVRDLLRASGAPAAIDEVKSTLAALPDDADEHFKGLDNRLTVDHMAAYFNVAAQAADSLTRSPERLIAAAGACAMERPLSAACVDGFLGAFGRRAFRRTLTPAELAGFRAYNDGTSPADEVFSHVILALMTSPRFLNRLEIDGAASGASLQLTPHELASRLSYSLWRTMPDDELLRAADDHSLLAPAGWRAQVDRLFADPRTKETIWAFWSEWLKLNSFLGFSTGRPAFRSLIAGEPINMPGHDHWGDMVQEIRALTEHVAFAAKGTMADLLGTDVSVTRSPDLARLYQVAVWDGRSALPRVTNRRGLFTRAALLAIGEEETNPFHRGAIIRRRLLCDPLPQPDAVALPEGSLDLPARSQSLTTRKRYEAKTAGGQCLGCHVQFNDIGYVMESYDSLGRYRTVEKVFDDKGAIVGELPIDTVAVPRIEPGDARSVANALELVDRVVESKKADACFATSFFTYLMRRLPVAESADACAVASASGGSLAEIYKQVVMHPGFRARRLDTP